MSHAAQFSLSDWRDLMKTRKLILLLASSGAMFQFFSCKGKGVFFFDAINQGIQSFHALGLI